MPSYSGPVLDNCCGCYSLKTGSIISGIAGMIVGALTLVYIWVTDTKMKTIVIDTLPPDVVKIIVTINLIMTIFISLMLIIGVIKRVKFMMLPWVILAIMLAIGLGISVVYTAIVFIVGKEILNGFLFLLFGILSVGVYIYMWLVVYSYYQLLREEAGRGPYQKPHYRR